MLRVLIFLVSLGARAIRAMCRRRADLVIENLALRQQVTALKKERPRPPLEDTDRAFWVALRSSWPAWASRLVIVNADTVARWNRDRFRRYWARISRPRYPGRPQIDAEIRRLVRTMAQDGWGAPRIHAEADEARIRCQRDDGVAIHARLVKKFVRHFDRVARPEYGLTRPCYTNYSGSTRLRVIADQYRNRPTILRLPKMNTASRRPDRPQNQNESSVPSRYRTRLSANAAKKSIELQ